MADQGGGPDGPAPVGRLRATLLNAPFRWLGGAVAAVVVLVSGAFGGFDKVTPHKAGIEAFTVDQPFDAAAWKVTIHSVRALDELPPLKHQDEQGWRWIIVVATVEITGYAESTTSYEKALQIRGIEGVPSKYADKVALATDTKDGALLGPGVPARLGFFWDQRAGAAVPKELQVGVYGMTYKLEELSGLYGWYPDEPDAPPRAMRALPVDTRPVAQ
ncbi:hypothetical protein KZZ52_49370 [Dactylosporangium sp. AC04546]|uniref:hypothetical protein n=1 Tax=Dactylosporangium sp. AC04546 TaxID=2862460 RepID=UPI001EE061B8|nr:hypothetical protein [Dactylosporangium sp. AC04546]WVK81898.1 hypothetical protein KZZ52_49370 [Dactylosporangium sp. AC04546]